jgi:hypothetical protein
LDAWYGGTELVAAVHYPNGMPGTLRETQAMPPARDWWWSRQRQLQDEKGSMNEAADFGEIPAPYRQPSRGSAWIGASRRE